MSTDARPRRTLARLALTGTAAVVLVGLAAPATAAPLGPARAPGAAVSSPLADSPAEQAAVVAYWTPARMKAAKDGSRLASEAGEGGTATAAGTPSTVPGKKATAATASEVAPKATVGKVFFTLGGVDYVCSGNVVSTPNDSVVATAGHCVNEGPGAFATSWTFVPAYRDGAAPYGTWTARTLVTTGGWRTSGDIDVDTGFAVMNLRKGQRLADVTGATGVAFNQPRGLGYTLYGYPAAAPFDGETLQRCAGRATKDTYGGTRSQGVPCDMTGGSSGGPWFTGGVQNSVNSFGYTTVKDRMFGPYWGTAVQAAYQRAATL